VTSVARPCAELLLMCNHVQPAVSTGSCQQVCSRICMIMRQYAAASVLQWCATSHTRHELSHHLHLLHKYQPLSCWARQRTRCRDAHGRGHPVCSGCLLGLSFRTRCRKTLSSKRTLQGPSFAPPSAAAADKHASTVRADQSASGGAKCSFMMPRHHQP
jgi:phage/plasmid primase-like uncharacterized protein